MQVCLGIVGVRLLQLGNCYACYILCVEPLYLLNKQTWLVSICCEISNRYYHIFKDFYFLVSNL